MKRRGFGVWYSGREEEPYLFSLKKELNLYISLKNMRALIPIVKYLERKEQENLSLYIFHLIKTGLNIKEANDSKI